MGGKKKGGKKGKKGKGGKKKGGGGGPVGPDPNKKKELPDQPFGLFISEHPWPVFACVITVQILGGILFSYMFKHNYIHHPKNKLKKVVIE